MQQKFINIQQASQLVCLSVPMIKKLIASGKIPSYKVEGKRLFDKDELIEWVRSKRDKRCEHLSQKRKELS